MIKSLSKLKSSILTVIFLALLLGNAYVWHLAWLSPVLLGFYAFHFGSLLGRALAPNEHPFLQWWQGAFWLASGIMLLGTAIYYAAGISPLSSMVLALLSVPAIMWLGARAKTSFWHRFHDLWQAKTHRIPGTVWFSTVIIIFCLSAGFSLIWQGQTTEAVRTVWSNIPVAFFLAFGLAILMLGAQLWRGRERALGLTLTMALLFLAVSVAVFVFPLGYGFDSFIHKTTEEYIAAFGNVSPKPFYYIGQYSLVLFIHQVFGLAVESVDKWLLPVLTAAWLPAAWYAAAAHILRDRTAAAAAWLGIFLMPLSAFIATTPQGLANLWILLTVLAAVPHMMRREKPGVLVLLIPALAALATHPIAGLPLLLFVILLFIDPAKIKPRPRSARKILFWLAVILGGAALPAGFAANSWLNTGTLGLNLAALSPASLQSALHWELFFENRFAPWTDLIYLYGYNAAALIFLVALLASWRERRGEGLSLRLSLIMAGILIINYFFLSTVVDFSFLIDYERQNYAARLIPIMCFFLSPLFILGLGRWRQSLRRGPVILSALTLGLISIIAASSVYLAYPRDDAYERGHGFNTAQSDINAVYEIERMAKGRPYAVLANQAVSAAAIRHLGFDRYFGDMYFYPIPTGGELYAYFLTMNETPNKKTAQEALDMMAARGGADFGPEILFYAVNDYWWQAPRLVENGKNTADAWFALDSGKIHVFVYYAN